MMWMTSSRPKPWWRANPGRRSDLGGPQLMSARSPSAAPNGESVRQASRGRRWRTGAWRLQYPTFITIMNFRRLRRAGQQV
jgi:hypothetical protein